MISIDNSPLENFMPHALSPVFDILYVYTVPRFGDAYGTTRRWLMLIAEFDQRCGWGGAKIRSCAHMLGTRVNYYRAHPEAFPRERFDEERP
jgi:hypothetical protein